MDLHYQNDAYLNPDQKEKNQMYYMEKLYRA